jgi:hypothetical protein
VIRLKKETKYDRIIMRIFELGYISHTRRIRFTRDDIVQVMDELRIPRIKNLGDIVYSYRYRKSLPISVQHAAPAGYEWIIVGVGSAIYEFRLAVAAKIQATAHRAEIKIPDATPEILKKYAPGRDEQALLTKVRYNRLIDIFTGLTSYSIQNHYRTTVPDLGQIEIDEIYVGISKNGTHYVMPCQAKSPKDHFGVVQAYQDVLLCRYQYAGAICRPIGIQFTGPNSMALLELEIVEEEEIFKMNIVEEKHYRLVPYMEIDSTDLSNYMNRDTRNI